MIERIIHHIWVGPESPNSLLRACRDSVVLMHPDWTIEYWNELPIKECLQKYSIEYSEPLSFQENHRFADVVRYLILYEYGGFYFDHDIWSIRPFDDLVDNEIVFGAHKFGDLRRCLITNALLGAKKGLPMLLEAAEYTLMKFSNQRHYNMGGLAHIARKYKLNPYSFKYFYPHYYKEATQQYVVFPETHSMHLWHRHMRYDLDKLKRLAPKNQE